MPGVNYTVTFSAVMDTTRAKLIPVMSLHWRGPTRHGDVPNAYVKVVKKNIVLQPEVRRPSSLGARMPRNLLTTHRVLIWSETSMLQSSSTRVLLVPVPRKSATYTHITVMPDLFVLKYMHVSVVHSTHPHLMSSLYDVLAQPTA